MNVTALAKQLKPWADNRVSHRRGFAMVVGVLGVALGASIVTAEPVIFAGMAWNFGLLLGGLRLASKLNERRLERVLVPVRRRR